MATEKPEPEASEQQQGRPADSLGALLEYVQGSPCAMERTVLDQMLGIVERHIVGVRLSPGEIEERIALAGKTRARMESEFSGYRVEEGTAIIPIFGLIAKYARMVNGTSEPRGTSVEVIGGQLTEARGDVSVRKILLHIESPGGFTAGIAGLGDGIRAASAVKPVIAYIDDFGASAAYWLASQAQAIYANRAAQVGGIGIYTVVVDSSGAAEKRGLKFHLLRSGEMKGVGMTGVPVTDRQLGILQERVDQFGAMFQQAVVDGRADAKRPIDAEQLGKIADGRMFLAADALELGLIDGIATFKQALAFAVPNPRAMTAATMDGAAEFEFEGTQAGVSEMTEADTKQADADAKAQATEAGRAEGREAERQRISAIGGALSRPMFAEVVQKAIKGDLDVTAAVASAMPVALAALDAMEVERDEANERLAAIAQGGGAAIDQEAGDDQAKAEAEAKTKADEAEPAKAFQATVDELVAGGKSITEAYAIAEKADPEGFDAWRAAQATSPVKRRR